MMNKNNPPDEIYLTVYRDFILPTWDKRYENEDDIRYIRAEGSVIWNEAREILKQMAEERKNCEACKAGICSVHMPMSSIFAPFIEYEREWK